MTQNASDVEIANQGFAAFRQDLNDVLEDITTLHSGTAAPSTTYANQWWYETDTDKLYIRNEDNDAWIELLTLDQVNDKIAELTVSAATVENDLTVDAGTFKVDSTNNRIGINNASPSAPIAATVTTGSDDIFFDVKNTAYSSTNSSGESKIRFGWNNHTAANIAAYKQSVNRTGFKFYSELGFNVETLALTIDPDGNLAPEGGVYLGGTGSANHLDDYEEGTWTPAFAGGGNRVGTWDSTLTGVYTKIGRLVQINFNISGTSMGFNSYGGYSYYTGLPFPVANFGSGAWASGGISSNQSGLVWVDTSERIWLYTPQTITSTINRFDVSVVYYTT